MKNDFTKRLMGIGAVAVMLFAAACKPADSLTDATSAEPAAKASAGAAVAKAQAESDLPVLGKAPAWTLTKIDGSTLSSADLKGKVVVIDFWATWCPPCRAEIPGYVEMQKAHEAAGLVIVGVSLDQKGPPVVRSFAQEYAINYPLVMGDDKMVAAFGGVEAIPTTFLIDRDGQVRHRKVGMMEKDEYEALIASLL